MWLLVTLLEPEMFLTFYTTFSNSHSSVMLSKMDVVCMQLHDKWNKPQPITVHFNLENLFSLLKIYSNTNPGQLKSNNKNTKQTANTIHFTHILIRNSYLCVKIMKNFTAGLYIGHFFSTAVPYAWKVWSYGLHFRRDQLFPFQIVPTVASKYY